MADHRTLNPDEEPATSGSEKGRFQGGDRRRLGFPDSDRSLPRASLYFLVFVVLFVVAFGPVPPSAVSNTGLLEILGAVSTVLSLVVGSLALVRFYSRKRGTFLFLGTGFLGSGVIDFVHTLRSQGLGPERSAAQTWSLSAWSFSASGTYLAVFFLVSWFAWRREGRAEASGKTRGGPGYITAAALSGAILVALLFIPTTLAFYPDATVRQPAEFFPAAVFLLALAGYLSKGYWRHDALEHWLVLALVLAVMAHGAFMPFAADSGGADFLLAHLLKVLSHTCVLVGLMASVYITFRREEEAADAAQAANAALAREIEVRRQAERVLQKNEEQLQDFLDNAHDLIQSVAPDGSFLYVNRAWQEVLGYTAEDAGGLTFFDVIHPSCETRCREQFTAAFRGEALSSVDVDFRTADGRVVRCTGSAHARLEDGRPVEIRSILRDVTAQVETRRELEAFQANLRALVENTGDAIWSVDRSLRLITFNTAFSMALEARTGREPRVQDLPEDVFPESDSAWYREMYQRSLQGAAFSELRDVEIGGQLRSFEVFFNPIREAMGITGVAAFGKDVTARRQTQLALRIAKEDAERANQAKSHFLANMSHELRTPLNSVIGFTNILLKNRSGHLGKQELNFLERISANGRHLLQLINQVLDLAKIEAGRMDLDREPVDLQALLDETLKQMEGQIKEKPVRLRSLVPEKIEPLETDRGKLKQILINLVGNALKFTDRGEVIVEAVPQPESRRVAAIAVRDTGIGIQPERLQAIFEAFRQADGTTSRRFGGTGLGLAISRSLCQLLGYDLKVESEVGVGSVFSILVTEPARPPIRPEDALIADALKPMESSRPRSGATSPSGPPVTNRAALVVDDDADAMLLLTHHLEDLGYDVLTATSAGEGLEQARNVKPDLITLDLMLPGLTGWEALRQLKEDPELSDIPVILVSTVGEGGDRADLAGAAAVVSKPLARDHLLSLVDRNLGESRNRTVLVVEDDGETRALIRDDLAEAGVEVILAANGREAEDRIREAVPDLILLDLVMPVMDGLTFLRRLKGDPRHRSIPVVVCTGTRLSGEEQDRLRSQAIALLSRDGDIEEPLRAILSRFFPLPPGQGDEV